MATPPLPDIPCVRVRLSGNLGTNAEWGNRFYLAYSGSAPTGANCVTLAGDIATIWAEHIAQAVNPSNALEEVDVLDIATDMGLSGQWTGNEPGTEGSGANMPLQVATTVEYNIARRYRGGKPRIYLPPASMGMASNEVAWSNAFVTDLESWVPAFFSDIAATSVGAMGTLKHVNLSYYQGYTNVEVPGTRAYAKPTYRPVAIHDDIVGYSPKKIMSSQRRRRTATTP